MERIKSNEVAASGYDREAVAEQAIIKAEELLAEKMLQSPNLERSKVMRLLIDELSETVGDSSEVGNNDNRHVVEALSAKLTTEELLAKYQTVSSTI